jgi:AcrR family transcriptional regulator
VGGSNGGDPTLPDRIRRVATRAYAERGRFATLDEIAATAGVSRSTLDHHFPDESLLREAINEHVMTLTARYFGDAPLEDDEDYSRFGRRITNLLTENRDEIRYVARGAVDGDPDGLAMFDAFMAIALQSYRDLRAKGVLDPGVDVEWASIHQVVWNLAVMLFEHAIDNHLPEPLSTEEGVERWHQADTELFRHGWLRPETRYRHVET